MHKGVSVPYQLHCWPEMMLELELLEGTELFTDELLVLAIDELLGLEELLGVDELLGMDELLDLEELLVATLDELTVLDELVPPLLPCA